MTNVLKSERERGVSPLPFSLPLPLGPTTPTLYLIGSMMPLFIANFGSTLDSLGEPVPEGEEESIVDSVASFCIIFGIIGAVSGIAGFTMVTLWSIAGERQVR